MDNESKITPYSHHVFLCPFRMDSKANTQKTILPEKYWETFIFKIEDASTFNERVYFYDFIYAALFDEGNEESPIKQYGLKEYRKEDSKKIRYNLYYRKANVSDSNYHDVELDVENIILNIYESGIAILSFHLTNNRYKDLETIKAINECCRRIYPQFLSDENEDLSYAVRRSFLPNSIELEGFEVEEFNQFRNVKNLPAGELELKQKYLLPSFIRTLLSVFEYDFTPLIDDRMFALSWIAHNDLCNELSDKDQWKHSEDWHNLIFCDKTNNGNQANENFRDELNVSHTHERWSGYGTFYGISRYSFVALTSHDFGRKYILPHITTIYFQMVQLVIMQRASILKFSDDAAKLASDIKNSIDNSDYSRLKELQINYIRFMNRLYFREVTAQEQGIDLYNMLQDKMKIPSQLKGLQAEIQDMMNLSNLIKTEENLESQKNEQDKIGKLTIIATLFLIPTLITGFLGMNVIDWSEITESDFKILGWSVFLTMFLLCALVISYALDNLTFSLISGKKQKRFVEIVKLTSYVIIGMLICIVIQKFS